VVHIGKHKVCLGCSTIYPALIASLVLLIVFRSELPNVNPVVFIAVGFIPVLLKLLKIDHKGLKALVNVIVGAGMGLAVFGIFTLPIYLILRILIFVVLVFVTSYIYFKRVLKHLKECNDLCEHKAEWNRCPGVKKMYRAIERDLGLKK
jgi:hypothetical protein